MSNPFLTGRTTRMKFSGAISAASQTVGGGPDGTALADTSSQVVINCNGAILTAWAYSKFDYGAVSNLQVTLTSPDGYSTSQLVHNGDGSGESSSIDGSGAWDVEFDVEEWAYVYTPGDSSAINGVNFPNYGGAAQGDGLPAAGIQYYLTMKPGGTFTCTITSGSVSLSHSFAISSAVSVGFLVNPVVYCSATGGDSNTTSVGLDYKIGSNDWPFDASYSQSVVSGGGTMTVSASGSLVEASVSAQGSCQITAFVNPVIQFDLQGQLRCFGPEYPGTAKVTWITSAGPTTSVLTPSVGAFSDTTTQAEWSCSAWYIGTSGTEVNFPAQSSEQWQAPAAWLSNLGGGGGSGDDPRDWRLQFRGYSWPAVSLQRAGRFNLDPSTSLAQWSAGGYSTLSLSGGVVATVSGGSGSLTLSVPHAKRVWEAYRLLGITCGFSAAPYSGTTSYGVGDVCLSGGVVYRAVNATTGNAPPNASYWQAIASLSLTLSAGTAWTLVVPRTVEQVNVELPCGTGDTSTVGTVQTRFPIANPGGFPINTDPQTQYSFGWGVNFCDAVTISGLPNGSIFTVSDVSLVSEGSSSQSAVTLLEEFLGFVTGWTSPTDITTVQPFLFVEADGKVLDIPALCLVTPTSGSTPPTWTYYTLAQLVTIASYFCGLTASTLPDPSDGYHGSGLPGLLLAGSESIYKWDTHQFVDWVDMPLPQVAIPAQDLWDEVQIYPGAGLVWTQAGSFGVSTPLRVSKSLRGQATGLVYDSSGAALGGLQVKTYKTATPSVLEGVGSSDSIGLYDTGTPWLYGNVDSTADLNVSPIPHLTNHGVVQNRQRFRSSFRHVRPTTKSLGYDVSRSRRHVRTYASSSTGTIGIRTAGNVLPQTWSDTDTGLGGIWARPRYQDLGSTWPIGVFYGDGTNCWFAQTLDDGVTWFNTTSMGGGFVGDFEEGADGSRWFFKLQADGSSYNVYCRLLGAGLEVVRDWTITSVTGIDNAPIACRESPVADGSWRIGLYYTVGGVETVKFSQDGLNFS